MSDTAANIVDACRAEGPAETRIVTIGDVRFVVRAPVDVVAACRGFEAFASVDVSHSDTDHLPVVHVAAGEAARRRLPPVTEFDPTMGGRPDGSGDLVVALTGDAPALYAATADRHEGAVWYADASRIAWWERARPLLPVVQALLRDSPWRVLHAAALGDRTGATLFTGGSHAGKTTLALTALLLGHHYFGDDVVAVRRAGDGGEPPHVARVYNTARLRRPPLRALEPLVSDGSYSNEMGEERTELYLGARLGLTPNSAPLVRLVHVQRDGSEVPRFSRVGRGRVLATVTATTLQVGFGDLGHHGTIAELCSVLRPIGFDPGADPVAAVHALFGAQS